MKTIEEALALFSGLTFLEKHDLHEWVYLNGIAEFEKLLKVGQIKTIGENYAKKLKTL